MKFYYLTDDSEKSLAPFFSKTVLSASFIGVVGVSLLSLMFWPLQPLSNFIVIDKIPLVFFLIFAATLIIYAYVNLCCGCGDMIQKGDVTIRHRTDKSTFEKEIEFLQYGLVGFLLHTFILLLPFLPILILAASNSAVGFITFIKAVSILYAASLLCRMFGFMVYLFWGRSSTIGYFLARAFMIVFIFGTLLFAPLVNPIQQLYLLNERPTATGVPFVLYMTAVMFVILLLTAANDILVRHHIKKEKMT